MKIAVTGAKGVVGSALTGQLDKKQYEITALDLPEYDVSDLEKLVKITKGHDAIIHCAWDALKDNYLSGNIDPINNVMTFNVYKAAQINGIDRVIMSSSNHAHSHNLPDADGKIHASIEPQIPDSPYGAEKIFMEALGRYFAHHHDLKVVCVRIGNINKEDKPNTDTPPRWMSHHDWGQLVALALEKDFQPGHFEITYGVSRQSVFDWSNSFGYEPQDIAQ